MVDFEIVSILADQNEPVTRDEVKGYLRINNTRDDTLIDNIIINARQDCERFLNKDIIRKQRRIFLSRVEEPFNLPYAPISSVDSFTIDDVAQVQNVGYELFGRDNPEVRIFGGVATFATGDEIPSVGNNVDVTYTTQGISGQELTGIKQGILCNAAWKYYGRDAKMPTNYKAYLSPYRHFGFFGIR